MSTKTHNNFTGIFCEHGPTAWQIQTHGILVNKCLAVKDVFAIKGVR
ncbi:amidase, partial [Pseudoalteromonas sp. S326]